MPSTTATTNTADVRSSKRLSNGTAVPGQEAYLVRKRELEVANEVAYETVKRRGAKTEVKIVQYRKFFETLELVGTYWDTSRDDVGMTGEEESKTDLRDSNKMDIDTVGAVEQAPDESKGDDRKTVYQAGKSDQDTNNTTTNTLKHAGEKHTDHEFSGERQDGDETAAPQTSKPTQEGNNSTKTTEDTYTYTGHRLSTGSQMPESYRLDLIRTFIEPLLWSFGLLAEPPRSQPRLQIQNLLIPVRHSAVIYRTPLWRARARAGCLEGPVMGVHCREDIVSRGDNECLGRMVRELFKRQRLTEKQYDEKVKRLVRETSSEVADLLREVGAMLLLGQERAREDQEEEFPGEGKWWVERPRWGGHKQEKESKEEKKKEEEGDGLDKSEAEGEALKEKRRRERMMEKWCEMQGPSSRWEKKVTYMHVGKIKEQEYDDVSFNLFFSNISSALTSQSPLPLHVFLLLQLRVLQPDLFQHIPLSFGLLVPIFKLTSMLLPDLPSLIHSPPHFYPSSPCPFPLLTEPNPWLT